MSTSKLAIYSLAIIVLLTSEVLAQVPTGKTFNGRRIMAGQCYGEAIRSGEFTENVISIKLLPGKTQQDISSIMATYGATVIEEFDAYQWGRVEIVSGHDLYAAVAAFEADPSIEYAEPLYVFSGDDGSGGPPLNEPDDPFYTGAQPPPDDYAHQWGFHNTAQDPPMGSNDADIDAPEAWVLSTGAINVAMAVLDSGFPIDQQTSSFAHPDLDDPERYFMEEDYYNEGVLFRDLNGHGTHVTGILGAESNNGIGVAGIDWKSTVHTYKILNMDNGDPDIEARHAIRDVAQFQIEIPHLKVVVNLSYGGDCHSQELHDALVDTEELEDSGGNPIPGILYLFAGGNDDRDGLDYPAAHADQFDHVIAIGSTNHLDQRSTFSNRGPQLTVSAPGGAGGTVNEDDIFSTLPPYTTELPRDYGYLWGTSMSTPMVTGTVGLMLSAWNGTTSRPEPTTIEQALIDAADDLGPPGHDEEYGHGRLNAYEAVKRMIELDPRSQILADGATLTGTYTDTNLWVSPDRSVSVSGTATMEDNGSFDSHIFVAGTLTIPVGTEVVLRDGNEFFCRPGGRIIIEGRATFENPGSCLLAFGTCEEVIIGPNASVTFDDGAFLASEGAATFTLEAGAEILSTSTARAPEIDPGTTFLLGDQARITLENEAHLVGTAAEPITFARLLDPLTSGTGSASAARTRRWSTS